MEWLYLTLYEGRLYDDLGNDANPHWPSFRNRKEADDWLVANDVRATLR